MTPPDDVHKALQRLCSRPNSSDTGATLRFSVARALHSLAHKRITGETSPMYNAAHSGVRRGFFARVYQP